ncbi:family 16 glycosylhydrolase [Polaribacter sp. Z014]|uniref:family 16 glycosylhydrolase n=1 Tax=unclassified Polaribacter TaxID=196858 RepID=UPI00193C0333|nr:MULTISPECIES: family 16 glycosylhydrolase [unclassified Polaribacter]MCL7765098.1 family 16 glycosylhydrolase [Polaribacter sp. Z014]QVY64958.1 family 16 glycosylhydrolase [Polaribacter sp. Q13]
MNKSLLFSVIVLISFNTVSQKVQPFTSKDGEKWTLKEDVSDEFDALNVDYKKWQKNPTHVQTWTWDNEKNVVLSDGSLKIIARFDDEGADRRFFDSCTKKSTPDFDLYFTSGMLKSYKKSVYGYYEARIKGAPLYPGLSPAFWMYSSIDDSLVKEGEVRYSEIDVVELTQRGTRVAGNERITDHNLHAIVSNGQKGGKGRVWMRPNDDKYRDKQRNENHASFDPRDDFHIYGCEVNEKEIIWFVDGVEIGRKANEFWHRPMNVALSLGIRNPYTIFKCNGFAVPPKPSLEEQKKFPSAMEVDYVRVWEKK